MAHFKKNDSQTEDVNFLHHTKTKGVSVEIQYRAFHTSEYLADGGPIEYNTSGLVYSAVPTGPVAVRVIRNSKAHEENYKHMLYT